MLQPAGQVTDQIVEHDACRGLERGVTLEMRFLISMSIMKTVHPVCAIDPVLAYTLYSHRACTYIHPVLAYTLYFHTPLYTLCKVYLCVLNTLLIVYIYTLLTLCISCIHLVYSICRIDTLYILCILELNPM